MSTRPTRHQPTTRERVLDTCRRLFNERGPAAVTTAEIADTVGINEGNLYYYFKKKEHIVLALFDELERALAVLAGNQMAASEWAESDEDMLMDFFKLAWEWRFFYRDAPTLYEIAPALRARNQTVAKASHESIRRLLQRLVEHGRLRAPPEVLERLVVNTWIVSTFWIEYLQVTRGLTRITRKHLEAGYEQVQSLYWPYLPEGVQPRKPHWD
jgi:AcrR family transcriptional regulator